VSQSAPTNYATGWAQGSTRIEPWDDPPENWQDEPDVPASQAGATMRRHGYTHAANRAPSQPSHPAEPWGPSPSGRASSSMPGASSPGASPFRFAKGTSNMTSPSSGGSTSPGDGAASFILGAILAANIMAYLDYGSAGVKSWWAAKFWNKPTAGLTKTSSPKTPKQSVGETETNPLVIV
jgi:hypothetical protein